MMFASLRMLEGVTGHEDVNEVGKFLRKAGESSECPYTVVMGKGRRWNN